MNKITNVILQRKLSESEFGFSKRMQRFFNLLELETIGDIVAIPIEKFTCFKGFKTKCQQEMIAFIEFEKLGYLFLGFDEWKDLRS